MRKTENIVPGTCVSAMFANIREPKYFLSEQFKPISIRGMGDITFSWSRE